MTSQSGGSAAGLPVGGVLAGTLPNPSFATNGATPILGTVSGALGVATAITPANTYVTGPSIALTAGIWFLVGVVAILDTVAGGNYTVRLWDGTTTVAESEINLAINNATYGVSLHGVLVVATTATASMAVAAPQTTGSMRTTSTLNGATGRASTLYAVRIA